jgi:hypothetical protein
MTQVVHWIDSKPKTFLKKMPHLMHDFQCLQAGPEYSVSLLADGAIETFASGAARNVDSLPKEIQRKLMNTINPVPLTDAEQVTVRGFASMVSFVDKRDGQSLLPWPEPANDFNIFQFVGNSPVIIPPSETVDPRADRTFRTAGLEKKRKLGNSRDDGVEDEQVDGSVEVIAPDEMEKYRLWVEEKGYSCTENEAVRGIYGYVNMPLFSEHIDGILAATKDVLETDGQGVPLLIGYYVAKRFPRIELGGALPLQLPRDSEPYNKLKSLLRDVLKICALDVMRYDGIHHIRLLQDSLCFTVMETEMVALAERVANADGNFGSVKGQLYVIGAVMHTFGIDEQRGLGPATLHVAVYDSKLRTLLNQEDKKRLAELRSLAYPDGYAIEPKDIGILEACDILENTEA